jgi:hypothetical protein
MPLSLIAMGCTLSQSGERPLAASATEVSLPPAMAPAEAPETLPPSALGASDPVSPARLAAPELAWSFRSASPVAVAPALVPGGGVIVTTVEGYVHRLGKDGGFEWSYTLRGNPIGGASVDGDAGVYVATSADRVYALEPSGRKRWIHEALVAPVTPVLWAAPGVVYFAGEDRRLYVLSARTGSLLWQRSLEHAVTGELTLAPRGLVALATRAPEVWLIRDAARAERVSVPAELAQSPLFADGRWFAQVGSEIIAYEGASHDVLWRCPGQHMALNAAGSVLVLEQAGALVWLATDSGLPLHRLVMPAAASAPPALTDSGLVLVPTASGVLFVLEPEPEGVVPVRVSWAPLRTPVYDPSSRQAVVSGGDGVITAVDLGTWLDRRDGA